MSTDYDLLCVDCGDRLGFNLKGIHYMETLAAAAPSLGRICALDASIYLHGVDIGDFFTDHGDHRLRIVGDDRPGQDLGDYMGGVRVRRLEAATH